MTRVGNPSSHPQPGYFPSTDARPVRRLLTPLPRPLQRAVSRYPQMALPVRSFRCQRSSGPRRQRDRDFSVRSPCGCVGPFSASLLRLLPAPTVLNPCPSESTVTQAFGVARRRASQISCSSWLARHNNRSTSCSI